MNSTLGSTPLGAPPYSLRSWALHAWGILHSRGDVHTEGADATDQLLGRSSGRDHRVYPWDFVGFHRDVASGYDKLMVV